MISTQETESALADARRKALANVQAALRGYECKPQPDGTLLIGRWGLFRRSVPNVDAAVTFAAQVGAAG